MRKLEWTRPAVADLRNIETWLDETSAPAVAARTLSAIRNRADFLTNFPHGGPPVFDEDFRSLRIHETPFLFIYRVRPGKIEILRIHHERENWRLDK